jgi:acyl-CoA thioester hydrolase
MPAIQIRVRYVECDMQGHVFNGHYLTWLDMAHTDALCRALGSYPSIVARGIELVVGECTIRFRAPARFDDELTVAVAFRDPGTTSLTSDFEITRDGTRIAEATMRHVCVDVAGFGKTPWPDWARTALAAAAD